MYLFEYIENEVFQTIYIPEYRRLPAFLAALNYFKQEINLMYELYFSEIT